MAEYKKQTVIMPNNLHAEIESCGKSRGCNSFSESIRHIARIGLDTLSDQNIKRNQPNWQDKIVTKNLSGNIKNQSNTEA